MLIPNINIALKASNLASITSPIHNWVLFWLHPFILSGAISPLISSSILGTYRPGEFHLSLSYLFAFSYCSCGSQGMNTEVICHSLLQWTTFCQTSLPWPVHLRWPHVAWFSSTELDMAVVHVIRLARCLWLWFQSVCPPQKFKGSSGTTTSNCMPIKWKK